MATAAENEHICEHVCDCLPTSAQVDWDKGTALTHLLDALGLDDTSNVLPIYIGDDQTDEDAFRVLRLRSDGMGILVSSKVRICLASMILVVFCSSLSTQGPALCTNCTLVLEGLDGTALQMSWPMIPQLCHGVLTGAGQADCGNLHTAGSCGCVPVPESAGGLGPYFSQ